MTAGLVSISNYDAYCNFDMLSQTNNCDFDCIFFVEKKYRYISVTEIFIEFCNEGLQY